MSERANIAIPSNNSGLTLQIDGPSGARAESFREVESLMIGSGPEARIRLNDPAVAALHLLLKRDRDRGFRAIDLGSDSGTRLQGLLLKGPAVLAPGDELRLGSTRIRVYFEESQATASVLHLPLPLDRVSAARAEIARRLPLPSNRPLPAELRPSENLKTLQLTLLWGDSILSVQHFPEGVPVTVGDSQRNQLQVFSPSIGESFTLAKALGSKFRLWVSPDADLVVNSDGIQKRREQLRSVGRLQEADSVAWIELGLQESAQISLGNLSFLVRFVRPSTMAGGPMLDESDFRFAKIAAFCAVVFIALLAAVVITSPGIRTSDEMAQKASKFVRFLVRPQERARAEKNKKGSLGAKASEKEGKLGLPEAKKDQAEASRRGTPVLDSAKREEDRRKVMSVGLLGALGGRPAVASNLFGPGGLGTGVNNALGGLRNGTGIGNAHGAGGLGSRGSGPGGGGTGLGLGGLGTKGLGTGNGGGGGDGYGSLNLGNRTKESTQIIPGRTVVVGGLSRDVIARVIRSHQHEIKYCYEMELQKNPSLSGKVAVVFTIDAVGSVSETKVSDTSLHNDSTEQCMLARIQRWKFPEPAGGGVVNVTFPWIFKPAGVDAKSEG